MMTLEKIKEMKIPVGTLIEIIYKENKEQIYFQEIGDGFDFGGLMCYSDKPNTENKNTLFAKGYFKDIPEITSIKRLDQAQNSH